MHSPRPPYATSVNSSLSPASPRRLHTSASPASPRRYGGASRAARLSPIAPASSGSQSGFGNISLNSAEGDELHGLHAKLLLADAISGRDDQVRRHKEALKAEQQENEDLSSRIRADVTRHHQEEQDRRMNARLEAQRLNEFNKSQAAEKKQRDLERRVEEQRVRAEAEQAALLARREDSELRRRSTERQRDHLAAQRRMAADDRRRKQREMDEERRRVEKARAEVEAQDARTRHVREQAEKIAKLKEARRRAAFKRAAELTPDKDRIAAERLERERYELEVQEAERKARERVARKRDLEHRQQENAQAIEWKRRTKEQERLHDVAYIQQKAAEDEELLRADEQLHSAHREEEHGVRNFQRQMMEQRKDEEAHKRMEEAEAARALQEAEDTYKQQLDAYTQQVLGEEQTYNPWMKKVLAAERSGGKKRFAETTDPAAFTTDSLATSKKLHVDRRR